MMMETSSSFFYLRLVLGVDPGVLLLLGRVRRRGQAQIVVVDVLLNECVWMKRMMASSFSHFDPFEEKFDSHVMRGIVESSAVSAHPGATAGHADQHVALLVVAAAFANLLEEGTSAVAGAGT